jgi:putative transposase
VRLEDGVRVGRKRVERLMRRAGLSGQVKRRRGNTTVRVRVSAPPPIFVDRGFSQTAINRL